MSMVSLQKLEQAIKAGNPFLAERLKPGLPESEARTALARAKITGAVEPLIALYSWKNGTILDEETALEKTGFFPEQIYQFVDLETAIQTWRTMNDAAGQLSEMLHGTEAQSMFELAGQYFPMFWDGATGSLAVDLKPSNKNRVVMVEFESTEPVCEASGASTSSLPTRYALTPKAAHWLVSKRNSENPASALCFTWAILISATEGRSRRRGQSSSVHPLPWDGPFYPAMLAVSLRQGCIVSAPCFPFSRSNLHL